MSLVRAEFARLAGRRFVQALGAVLLIAFVVTVLTTLASSHRPTAAELATAEQSARTERVSMERYHAQCVASQGPDTPEAARNCDSLRPEEIGPEDFLYGVFVFDSEIRPLVMFLAAFLTLFGFLVAATFLGAELTSGGMTNLLLWRPERTVVLGTKLGTVLATVLAVSVVSTVFYVATFWAIAQTSGLPGRMDAGEWGDLALLAFRGIVLALVATAAGFGLATLGRHTAAALGALAGYAVVWEIGARIVMEVIESAKPDVAMFSSYVGAWMTGRLGLSDRYGNSYEILWWQAALVFAAMLALFVGGAFVNFRRRDLA